MHQVYLLARRYAQHSMLQSLRNVEKLSASQVEELQDQLIRALLLHAYENVPYYRRIIDQQGGLAMIEKERAKGALAALPLLTKTLIRENWEDLKSRDLSSRKWYYNTSGGSTGEPVRLIQDWTFHQQAQAVKDLYDLWTGYRAGMPKVILWGSERDLLLGKETWKVRFGRWLRNEYWLNAFRMGPSEMRKYVEIINTVRPVQILAYVEAIYELAKFIEREGLKVWSPRAIMTSAGTLYGYMREVIERVFQAPVYNRYGSREVGDIACECEAHQGLHVCPLTHYVEILREDGTSAPPGEIGEVVVTSLINYAMPLIRYRIGDMAAWADHDCSCGRRWPLLKEVTGRMADTFISSTGRRVHGEYFTHLVYFRDWVKKFQFVQESPDRIRLLVIPAVPKGEINEIIAREKADIEAKIQVAMGPECKLEIEVVDDIPPSPSGKYRYTISKVAPNGN